MEQFYGRKTETKILVIIEWKTDDDSYRKFLKLKIKAKNNFAAKLNLNLKAVSNLFLCSLCYKQNSRFSCFAS